MSRVADEPAFLVDTHAHVFDRAFDADREALFTRAHRAGVRALICVGYDLATSQAAVELAEARPEVLATVGIHPNDVSGADSAHFRAIEQLARHPRVVGIGETGLDYYRQRTAPDAQKESLNRHLRLGEELHLPVIIHNREADHDAIALLEASASRRPAGEVPGVLHCFSSGDVSYLERALAAGYFVSFAGPITFRNADPLPDQARRVPLDRLLVETDCPYLSPVPHRGQRNEPSYLAATAHRLADILQRDYAALTRLLWKNTSRIFPAVAAAASPREVRS